MPATETRWESGPAEPRIDHGEVHVWLVVLAHPEAGRLEIGARGAPPARRPVEQRAALRSRAQATLRVLLGRYLGEHPGAAALTRSPHGKPELPGSLRFNLAHSGALALYGFCDSGEIGVDLECERASRLTERALARRLLGEEEAGRLALLAPQARRAELLRAWVRHEAVLKWQGTGFAAPARESGRSGSPWVGDLDTAPDAFAALALDRPPAVLRQWTAPVATTDGAERGGPERL